MITGPGKPQLHAKVEVASLSRCKNIKGKSQIYGAILFVGHAHFLVGLKKKLDIKMEYKLPKAISIVSVISSVITGLLRNQNVLCTISRGSVSVCEQC